MVAGDRLHCLELIDCFDQDRRHVVGPLGVKIGRTPPADVVLMDSEVSRSHCFVALKGSDVVVTDLGSTNGTVIVQPGQRPDELRPGVPVVLQVGAMIDLGDSLTIRVTEA